MGVAFLKRMDIGILLIMSVVRAVTVAVLAGTVAVIRPMECVTANRGLTGRNVIRAWTSSLVSRALVAKVTSKIFLWLINHNYLSTY